MYGYTSVKVESEGSNRSLNVVPLFATASRAGTTTTTDPWSN